MHIGDDPATKFFYVSTNGPDSKRKNVTWHRGDEPQARKAFPSVARCEIRVPKDKLLEGIVVIDSTDVSVSVTDLDVDAIALSRRTSGSEAKTARNAINLSDVGVNQLRSHTRGPGSHLIRNVALGRVAQIGVAGQYSDAKIVWHDESVGTVKIEGGGCLQYQEVGMCKDSEFCPTVLAEVGLLAAQITGDSY